VHALVEAASPTVTGRLGAPSRRERDREGQNGDHGHDERGDYDPPAPG
jgi:hypothetical protein